MSDKPQIKPCLTCGGGAGVNKSADKWLKRKVQAEGRGA